MDAKGSKKREVAIARSTIRFVAFLVILAPVASIDDKCAACNAVAIGYFYVTSVADFIELLQALLLFVVILYKAEIEIGLSNEKPKNHLDMRHRLDSRGQRQGKIIDYRMSELRVVELLDGLCEKMQDYTLEKLDSGAEVWVKVRDWESIDGDKQEARAYSKDLSSFCGRLLEETEDELAELIKRGSAQSDGVSKALCQDLSKHCRHSSSYSTMDDGEL